MGLAGYGYWWGLRSGWEGMHIFEVYASYYDSQSFSFFVLCNALRVFL